MIRSNVTGDKATGHCDKHCLDPYWNQNEEAAYDHREREGLVEGPVRGYATSTCLTPHHPGTAWSG